MYPSFPQSLHLELVDVVAKRNLASDPDGFVPEWHAYQPDPVGLWLVRQAGSLADHLAAVKMRLSGAPGKPAVLDETCLPPAGLA